MQQKPNCFIGTFWQFDTFIQFFVGKLEDDREYIDNWKVVVKNNLLSPAGFSFDCITSIPWSCLDLYLYLVLSAAPLLFGTWSLLPSNPSAQKISMPQS